CTTASPPRNAAAAALEPPGPAPTTSRSQSAVSLAEATREVCLKARGPRVPRVETRGPRCSAMLLQIRVCWELKLRVLLDVLLVLQELLLEPVDRFGQRLGVAGR